MNTKLSISTYKLHTINNMCRGQETGNGIKNICISMGSGNVGLSYDKLLAEQLALYCFKLYVLDETRRVSH